MRGCSLCAFLVMAMCYGSEGVRASDWTVAPDPAEYTYDVIAGGEMTAHSWSLYAGSTSSFATDIRADGFKLRGMAGYGGYTYTSPRWDGKRKLPISFSGQHAYGDVFLGYQHTFGPWIVKGFVGLTQQWHAIAPYDIENSVQGSKYGLKAALETWLTIGDKAFVQTDASWAQTFQSYSARIRGGWRFNPNWSAGLELGATGNATYDGGRVGSFLRFEWSFGEVSISAGGTADRSDLTGPYGSVGVTVRF